MFLSWTARCQPGLVIYAMHKTGSSNAGSLKATMQRQALGLDDRDHAWAQSRRRCGCAQACRDHALEVN